MKGAFITLEGIEGVGKSTALADIERRLLALGHEVVLTREPGGTELGERIREWMLEGQHERVSREVEALLMFAARGQHLQALIQPALERGTWVVCDRFTDATFAYQGGGRGVSNKLLDCLTESIQHGLQPDLTLLLDAPVEVGFNRIRDREPDNFEREQKSWFERVRATYLHRAEGEPDRIRVVDASRSQTLVAQEVDELITDFSARYVERG